MEYGSWRCHYKKSAPVLILLGWCGNLAVLNHLSSIIRGTYIDADLPESLDRHTKIDSTWYYLIYVTKSPFRYLRQLMLNEDIISKLNNVKQLTKLAFLTSNEVHEVSYNLSINLGMKRFLSALNNFKKWIYLVVVPSPSINITVNSERSDECIDFTMIITNRNNASISNFGGGFRWKNEYLWCIIELLINH
ncbi:hypothetical protein AGLY_010917 [Aphis glycines]|uniref:Uncharacterized protein n=1 Tax=Aphis glycines TaxID=307491 RepID=A0A6G0TCV9_APHGL|nr:hypothetical protein AGLY_010917 [Aphis glycines]